MIRELIKELQRFFEALMGRISLSAWMDTVHKFTDETILNAEEKEGLLYQHGTCNVKYVKGNDISAEIQLIFKDQAGKVFIMEAKRTFPEKRFLSESLRYMAQQKQISIPINSPGQS